MTNAIRIMAASVVLAFSTAQAQQTSAASSVAFAKGLFDATEGTALARARPGIRYLDVNRTAQLLSAEFADALSAEELRASLPESYRDIPADDVRECASRTPRACTTRESGVVVSIDDLHMTRDEIRTVVIWRDGTRKREQGMGIIEWEVVFHRAGDRWVLATHRVRRLASASPAEVPALTARWQG